MTNVEKNMKSLILNEGYKSDKNSVLFEKGIGDKIFFKGKKFIDLSHCSGSLLFGHNSQVFVKSLKNIYKKNFLFFLIQIYMQINFQN